jgi:hypothetical protein
MVSARDDLDLAASLVKAPKDLEFCQKKPRRLGRGFVPSWGNDAADPRGNGSSAPRHSMPMPAALQITFM